MKTVLRLLALVMFLCSAPMAFGQTQIKAKIIDAQTKEPIDGASVRCADSSCCSNGCSSNASGEFILTCGNCKQLCISYVGYTPQYISVAQPVTFIALSPYQSLMQEVVVFANRGEAVKRAEAPIAISVINQRILQETKALTPDLVLNKVSGVNMVNLGNEQHQMSIRQPITTRSLFLYLEDGIPVRTTGVFNHNALLEMNMAATRAMEVIKGPSSSLYGSEAIGGVVNFITIAPTSVPVLKLMAQGNNIGYRRADLQATATKGKWGMAFSGYYADKRNSFMEYSDYHKGTFTFRIDYRFSPRTTLTNSMTAVWYYSDMPSGVDSTMFATRTFSNPQTFTYRKVSAQRFRSTLTHHWNDKSKTTFSLVHRNNTISQNPAYRIKDDYRKVNGTWKGNKTLAHGEENASSFKSYAFIGQHRQSFSWMKAVAIGGLSVDLSPSGYRADYIRIQKDTISRKYTSYVSTDSTLTRYKTRINNYAAFANLEFSPVEKLRIVASLRYDLFHYRFNNDLSPSAFSGSPDTANRFSRFSPKFGATYNLSGSLGFYANYSEGFVPPQVTEMYTGVKVPYLQSSSFYNYEIGGWAQLIPNKISADLSLYRLRGTNEVVSVKLDDGSFANQNAGSTIHEGIELGIRATPVKSLNIRFSGAYSKHVFKEYVEKGSSYNGNEMNNAPSFIFNTEVWYRPAFVRGLRVGAELQHVGSYFVDPQNTARYEGYKVLHLRAGYQFKGFELWANLLNATDRYYSNITIKSAFGYSYQLAEPRNITLGLSCDLAQLIHKNQQ